MQYKCINNYISKYLNCKISIMHNTIQKNKITRFCYLPKDKKNIENI